MKYKLIDRSKINNERFRTSSAAALLNSKKNYSFDIDLIASDS